MWTIFGVGNLFYDIIDAIYSNNTYVHKVVINQPSKIDLSRFNVVNLENYKSDDTLKICGYIDPNKDDFTTLMFDNLIHRKAYLASFNQLGMGNYLGAGCVIATQIIAGNFNYFNRNSSVGHDTVMGSFNHVGPGAVICGRCKIGDRNTFGAGCVIRDGIKIDNEIKIGAGAVVVSNLIMPGVYVGNPARKIEKTAYIL